MTVLWLRFLTEIDTYTEHIPAELEESPEIHKALEELKVTGFTDEELRAYDKLLDNIRVERTLQQDSFEKGMEEGIEKGIQKGIDQGIEKGETRKSLAIAKKMLLGGLSYSQIMDFTGLTKEQIEKLNDLN